MIHTFVKTIPDYDPRAWPPLSYSNVWETIEDNFITRRSHACRTLEEAKRLSQDASDNENKIIRWRWVGNGFDILACGVATPEPKKGKKK